jgi:DNA invertase Pin-like site-specific DNA recombinase
MENQRRVVIDFAAAEMYEDCTEYIDNGENGLTFDRPAFSQLRDDIRTGKIDIVFMDCISRIGRDIIAVHEWLYEMRTQGVRIVLRNEGEEMPLELYSLFVK